MSDYRKTLVLWILTTCAWSFALTLSTGLLWDMFNRLSDNGDGPPMFMSIGNYIALILIAAAVAVLGRWRLRNH
jgi:hypothetical protein